MTPEWVPVWLSIAGTFGTIATLIVTHILNKRATKQQTATIQAATTAQTETIVAKQDAVAAGVETVRRVANGRVTELLEHKARLEAEVRKLKGGIE